MAEMPRAEQLALLGSNRGDGLAGTSTQMIAPPPIIALHYLECDRRHCGCLPRWAVCPAGEWVRENPREAAS